jgi:hypothetical protein
MILKETSNTPANRDLRDRIFFMKIYRRKKEKEKRTALPCPVDITASH